MFLFLWITYYVCINKANLRLVILDPEYENDHVQY